MEERSPSPPPKRPKLEEVEEEGGAFEPSPLAFKAFLATQEEEVEEEAALASYREYTADFKRRTLQRFFETHSGEEWLREAYHPQVAARVVEEQREAVARRSRVYWRAMEELQGASLQVEQADRLVELMDTFVHLLEEEETKETKGEENNNEGAEGKTEEPGVTVEEGESPEAEPARAEVRPRSVYLRRVPPAVTMAELQQLGSTFPGLLRVAAGAPRPADDWSRGAWLTFAPATDVRAVCLALAGRSLGAEELEVAVNRPLVRRVLPAPALAGHPTVVARDLAMASRLVTKLDAKWGIDSCGLLEGVAELLSKEMVELEEAVEEQDMVAVLDRVMVYLRTVHSVDWYACSLYREDRMPSRLGLLHARQALPQGVPEGQLQEHLATSQARLDTLVADKQLLSEEQVQELGGKQEQVEVDRFVEANVERRSKDKWLVRLSGKKFKGLEFARKHILARFPEHVADVGHDVCFFNSFLADPGRPRLPDRPRPKKLEEPEIEVVASVPPRSRACGSRPPPLAAPGPWERRGWGQGGVDLTRLEDRRPVDYSDIDDMLGQAHVHRPCPW